MNSTQSLANWLSQINANQQVFAGRRLDKILLFLRNARTPGEGWGEYPRLGSDLHHSALAIQALSFSGDVSSVGTVAGAAAVLRKDKAGDLSQLAVEDLCDLIVIARVEQKADDDNYIDSLVTVLQQRLSEVGQNNLSLRTLCSAVQSGLDTGRVGADVIKGWIDHLIGLQRPDGGWPAVAGQASMIVPTALVLRVLTKSGKGSTTESLRRGLYFLQGEIERLGWSRVGSAGDTFTQSVALRALAEVPGADYRLIQDGVDNLIAKMNQDGSWGDAVADSGNVESTSLSLLALVAAGENRFIPARLVNTALIDIQQQLNDITDERNRLRDDFEKRVLDDCGEVVQQRNALTKENQELKSNIRGSQDRLKKVTELKESAELRQQVLERELELSRLQGYDFISRSSKSRAYSGWRGVILQFLVGVPLILAIFLTWWLWRWPLTWFRVVEMILILITGVSSSWILFRRDKILSSASYSPYTKSDYWLPIENRPSSDLESLRYMYMDMAQSWPAYLREEVVYRLLSEMADMPPDIGARYMEEMTFRFDMSPSDRSQLSSWMRYALRLSPAERRILFDQLRKFSLR